MHNKLEKTRIDWVDIVKFWGILAIVLGHTLRSGSVRQYLFSFHVPLFFFVIGLFFTAPKLSFWRFTAKKAKDLLVPYFFFAIISILIFSVLGTFAASALDQDVAGNSLPANFLEMLAGQCRANRPLWFLPSMFCCYIICFGLARILKNQSSRIAKIAASLVIAISIAFCFINESFFNVDSLFWKIDVAVFMLAFVAAAFLMKPLFAKRLPLGVSTLLALLLLAGGGAIGLVNAPVIYLENYYGNAFLFYIGAFCSVAGFCFLSIVLSQCKWQLLRRPLVYVGKRTLPILLMHKFPILFFQVIFPWTKQPLKDDNFLVSLLVSIISIAACLAVNVLLQKLFAAIFQKK